MRDSGAQQSLLRVLLFATFVASLKAPILLLNSKASTANQQTGRDNSAVDQTIGSQRRRRRQRTKRGAR